MYLLLVLLLDLGVFGKMDRAGTLRAGEFGKESMRRGLVIVTAETGVPSKDGGGGGTIVNLSGGGTEIRDVEGGNATTGA